MKIPKDALGQITAPTLVIHGEADPLVRTSAARALVRAIPGARLVTYPGMGHSLPPALWPRVLHEISALTTKSATPPAPRGATQVKAQQP